MDMITIDQEKCVKDGICAAECPTLIINAQKGFPEIVKGAQSFCINCGHCVAVCPTAALSHKNLSPEDCMQINKEMLPAPEQMELFLRNRRSIRAYKKKQVPKDILQQIITIASHAPSGHNRQPVQWHVIYERDELTQLCGHVIDWMKWMIKEKPDMAKAMELELVVAGYEAGSDILTRGTPHLILAHGNKHDFSSESSCTIAMTWLELALPSFGLGGCWCGYFNAATMFWPPLQAALGLPKNNLSYGAMMVGYPKFAYHRIPPRNKAVITGL
ncbi:MAG: nitroreductase family protein [Desulfamplus sp.]|nr:nitroreductase family protein [Desulfamplus sp.]